MGPSWPSRICTSMDRPTQWCHIILSLQDRLVFADNARANFFRPGGDHLTLLNVYNEVLYVVRVSMPCSQYGTGNKTQFILLFLLSSGSKRITPLSGALITSYSTGLHQTSLSDAQCIGVHVCGSLCPAAQVHEEGTGYQGPVGGTDGTC